MSEDNRNYIETQNPKTRIKKKSRRTRFGDEKQNVMRPHPVPTIHPDDLPQRARWTIIITAGLLLITCMLLVGVTLRMAPVIDELGKLQLKLHLGSYNITLLYDIRLYYIRKKLTILKIKQLNNATEFIFFDGPQAAQAELIKYHWHTKNT